VRVRVSPAPSSRCENAIQSANGVHPGIVITIASGRPLVETPDSAGRCVILEEINVSAPVLRFQIVGLASLRNVPFLKSATIVERVEDLICGSGVIGSPFSKRSGLLPLQLYGRIPTEGGLRPAPRRRW